MTTSTNQKIILKWFIYWTGMMAIFIYGIKPFGVSHIQNIHITITYNAFFIWGGFKLLHLRENASLLGYSRRHLLQISLTLIIFTFLTSLAAKVPITQAKIDFLNKMEFHYPLLLWQAALSKGSELIFQQTLIAGLILELKRNKLADKKIIIYFALLFFILHIPLIMVFKEMALIFIIPSLFGGFLFAYVILNFKNGVTWSFILHELFYLVGSICYRLY